MNKEAYIRPLGSTVVKLPEEGIMKISIDKDKFNDLTLALKIFESEA